MTFGKRTAIALLASMLIMPGLSPAHAQSKPEPLGFSQERLDRLSKAMQSFVDQGAFPGAVVLIARDGRVAYHRTFGTRDGTQPMTSDSIFRIASMTKPIVSVAAMMLVEEGKLSLAAPVATYLPELKDVKVAVPRTDPATGKTELVMETPRRPMIVQDLLRHTAGLVYAPPLGSGPVSDMYREAGVSTRDEPIAAMITKLGKLPLAHHPGEVWEYSVATDVLGAVIEAVSGQGLDVFIAEKITKPLGMTSTGFYVPETDGPRVAQIKPPPAGSTIAPLFDPTRKPARMGGGGAMVSTASDYLKFCQMMLNGGALGPVRLLSPTSIAMMTSNALRPDIGYSASARRSIDSAPTPQLGQGFGLGYSIRLEPGQNPLPGSVGSYFWGGAFGTSFYIDPKERLIMILMIQVPLGSPPAYRHALRYLTYQALVPAE
jgi:CubicO group peptidase (beta-lactamase class C family)